MNEKYIYTYIVYLQKLKTWSKSTYLLHTLLYAAALEPFFNAAASQFVLGHQIPLSLWLSLAPVVIGKEKKGYWTNSTPWICYLN